MLPPPPQPTLNAIAAHNRMIKPFKPEHFFFLFEKGKQPAAARNNEHAAKTFVRCNIAAAK